MWGRQLLFKTIVALLASASFVQAQCSGLVFSEYGEGANSDKWITVQNPTESVLSLEGCQVSTYYNGQNTTLATIALSEISLELEPSDMLILCNTQIRISNSGCGTECSIMTGNINHNGDDAIALEDESGNVVDVIGVIGEREIWQVNGGSTRDYVLARSVPTVAGDGTFQVSQWQALAVEKVPRTCPLVAVGPDTGTTTEPTTDSTQGGETIGNDNQDDNNLIIYITGGAGVALVMAVGSVVLIRRRSIHPRAIPGYVPGKNSLASASSVHTRSRNPSPMNRDLFAFNIDHGVRPLRPPSGFRSSRHSKSVSSDLKLVLDPPVNTYSQSPRNSPNLREVHASTSGSSHKPVLDPPAKTRSRSPRGSPRFREVHASTSGSRRNPVRPPPGDLGPQSSHTSHKHHRSKKKSRRTASQKPPPLPPYHRHRRIESKPRTESEDVLFQEV